MSCAKIQKKPVFPPLGSKGTEKIAAEKTKVKKIVRGLVTASAKPVTVHGIIKSSIIPFLKTRNSDIYFAILDGVVPRLVVIKVALPEIATREVQALERLKKSRVPHVIELINHFEVTFSEISTSAFKQYALVVPHRGVPVYSFFRITPLALFEIRLIAQKALETLKVLREYHAVHNDFTANNMLYDRYKQELTIIDWPCTTLPCRIIKNYANFYYRDPIFMLGHPNFDENVDMWGLGITLFQLVTGVCPFSAYADEEGFSLYLEQMGMIVGWLGMPSIAYIEKCKHKAQFFRITGNPQAPYRFNGPIVGKLHDWKEAIRTSLLQRKENPLEIEDFIMIVGLMWRYENRPSPTSILQCSFFQKPLDAKSKS